MSIYGEGKYNCNNCGEHFPKFRKKTDLDNKLWEYKCENCRSELIPLPTDEEKPLDSTSLYAMSKKHQERMGLLIGKEYGINTTALRFFNVYGSRQSLSNPYTGVCAIFCSNLLSGNPPIIFEDGLQTRDLINVKDICQALVLAMEKAKAKGNYFNVGTGRAISIKKIAEILIEKIKPGVKSLITNEYRAGDIRHCFADVTKIKKKLGFELKFSFEDGIEEFIKWIKLQVGKVNDNSRKAYNELKEKRLI